MRLKLKSFVINGTKKINFIFRFNFIKYETINVMLLCDFAQSIRC